MALIKTEICTNETCLVRANTRDTGKLYEYRGFSFSDHFFHQNRMFCAVFRSGQYGAYVREIPFNSDQWFMRCRL